MNRFKALRVESLQTGTPLGRTDGVFQHIRGTGPA